MDSTRETEMTQLDEVQEKESLFINNLKADFNINVDGIIYFNQNYLMNNKSEEIDMWYTNYFEETFDKLEEHYIGNSISIKINDLNKDELKRAINLLDKIPRNTEAYDMIAKASLKLVSFTDNDKQRADLLEMSLKYDKCNRDSRL